VCGEEGLVIAGVDLKCVVTFGREVWSRRRREVGSVRLDHVEGEEVLKFFCTEHGCFVEKTRGILLLK
jgi:hypothetical protein